MKPIFAGMEDGSFDWVILDLNGRYVEIFSEGIFSPKEKIYIEKVKTSNGVYALKAHLKNNKNLKNYMEIEGCHIRSVHFEYS